MGHEEFWDHGSDHAVIGAKVEMESRVIKLRGIDWAKVAEYISEGKDIPSAQSTKRAGMGTRGGDSGAVEAVVESGVEAAAEEGEKITTAASEGDQGGEEKDVVRLGGGGARGLGYRKGMQEPIREARKVWHSERQRLNVQHGPGKIPGFRSP